MLKHRKFKLKSYFVKKKNYYEVCVRLIYCVAEVDFKGVMEVATLDIKPLIHDHVVKTIKKS